jgi:homocysteine S-methyltransferase
MWVSFTCADGERTVAGDLIGDAARAVLEATDGAVDAIGMNCTAPQFVGSLLRRLAEAAPGIPLVAYPNHGAAWDPHDKRWIGGHSPDEFTAHIDDWVAQGARLIGGCCGVGSDGVRAIAARRASLA